ncbi:MAG: glycine--tRNA ligase [archaeon]
MVERKENKAEKITTIASKRGFFFQTAEIYGGKAGFFSYGHLGKLLKNRFENTWRKYFLGLNDNFYEVQSNNILPADVFIASGHVENFNDPMTECKKCNFRFRADQFLEDKGAFNDSFTVEQMNAVIKEKKFKCPRCGGELSEVRWFNMMFPLTVGFNDEKAYLSPETAQAAYLLFKQEFEATRKKLPLGLAIIDKAYRNEISPRQMFFRLREFTQAELQIFFDPADIDKIEENKWDSIKEYSLILKACKQEIMEVKCDDANAKMKIPKFYVYHMAKIQQFYLDILKIPKSKFRFRELNEEERAFYNKIHWDIELELETLGGFKEIAGLHYRTDHDLVGHAKQSKENLEIFFNEKKFIPHVLELSFGVDRNIWAFLDIFYKEELEQERDLFQFPRVISPIDIAVFPLVNKDGMDGKAEEIYNILKQFCTAFYDSSGSIGRRYRRQDEVGTPFCVTIDTQTMQDCTVTIRERDSMKQERVSVDKIKSIL